MPFWEGSMYKSDLNLRLLTPFEREVITLLRAILSKVTEFVERRDDRE